MKKRFLVLLTFVPIVAGYILNLTILLPGIGVLISYVLPLLTTAFWFYLGRQFAHTTWKTIPAILIGNTTGIVSILVYLWQFLLETDKTRNMALAGVSQMFSSSAPAFLLTRIALLFESEPNTIGMASAVALQILSVMYMIAIFCVAFLWEKNRIHNTSIE
ncbi:MAG: hypothetical protein IJ024_02885 [Lachnospiraceae bacterium]|nr:hypothetical protein [Lachnospiraceae bacterium]